MSSLASILSVTLPALVVLVLVTGLLGFATNADWYQRHANTLMKLRVSAQLLAILALMALMALR